MQGRLALDDLKPARHGAPHVDTSVLPVVSTPLLYVTMPLAA